MTSHTDFLDFFGSDAFALEDDRVLLRPMVSADVENLLYLSENEPEIWKYSLIQAGGGRENLANYIATALSAKEKEMEFPFVVFDKSAGKFAGSTRFYDINFAQKSLQLGYTWYGKEFQGSGLNKHCKFLLLRFAFENLGMERVEFRADASNERSIAAMKSIGCQVEGILRSHQFRTDGTRRDSIVLSILKGEWFSSVKPNLESRLG
ncbi:GNAT family protein [Flavobacterium sp.]|uniref:GNAT family N-acetyltransferase n=1 Tax=Flavobacterium sp. TaxID=239 RepID=UPI001227BE0E|nr:GNAT family protein [Flavobacterium sp.]RZJ69784.1 MAG: N-acetyltransferase [Flavobacterium sp.]